MFGTEHVTAATDWLKASPGRFIEITYDPNESELCVEFADGETHITEGRSVSLMDALMDALAGLPKA